MMSMPVVVRRGMMMAWDVLAWVFALYLLVAVRWEFALSQAQWEWAAAFTLTMVFLQVMIGLLTHTYMGRHRIGSFDEATWLGSFVLLFSVPVGLVVSSFQPNLPRAVVMMVPPTALALMAAVRGAARAMLTLGSRQINTNAAPVVVYGAGVAGH
ncbi:MAG: polysaccharide biosynthesis protein, partial [Acidobacteriota bacterium]|nr:polysaccharide biosynthesis protein [Acidobacteriota bacterium]